MESIAPITTNAEAYNELLQVFGDSFRKFSTPRKLALIRIMEWLGLDGFLDESNLVAAVKFQQWNAAAFYVLDSYYARNYPDEAQRMSNYLLGER